MKSLIQTLLPNMLCSKPKAAPVQITQPSSRLIGYYSKSTCWFNLKLSRFTTTGALLVVKAKRAKTSIENNVVSLADRLNNKTTPWLMLPPEVDTITGETLDCFYSLSDSKIVKLHRKKSLKVPDTAKCVASTLGSWLAFIDVKRASFYLSNPFLNDVVELPSLLTLPRVVGAERDPTGSILHYNVAFPDYPTGLWDDGNLDLISTVDPETMAHYMVENLALSDEDPRGDNCVAMAVQCDMRRLAYCHIGNICNDNTEKVWYGLQEDYLVTGLCEQIAYSSKNGLFYSLNGEGIQAFDVQRDRGKRTKKVSLLRMMDILPQLRERLPMRLRKFESRCRTKYYLLTLRTNGDLWLIVRHFLDARTKTLHFNVYRVAYPGSLERVTYLEDRAIFIGSNQSFCIKAGGSPHKIRPNCIYFTDDHLRSEWGHDMGIFNMKDGVITQFYPYKDEQEERKVPLTAALFWIAPLSSCNPSYNQYQATC